MSLQSELPCWEIIRCNRKHTCLLGGDAAKPCWEVVRDDCACSFHICTDCLVYLAKQKNSPLSDEEFSTIMEYRKRGGIRYNGCALAHSLR